MKLTDEIILNALKEGKTVSQSSRPYWETAVMDSRGRIHITCNFVQVDDGSIQEDDTIRIENLASDEWEIINE